MAQLGIKYYLDNFASFDVESNWKIWYNFKDVNTTSGVFNNIDSGIYSGIVQMTPSTPSLDIMFTRNDYMAIPSGRYGGVNISPATGLWSDDFSLIFLNEKSTFGKTLIFSCMETGLLGNENVYKGYRIGYTDNNKPFFEYYTNNGMECLVGDFNLPTNHSLNFIKNNNSLTIGYYDILKQQNNTQSYAINSDFLFEPS